MVLTFPLQDRNLISEHGVLNRNNNTTYNDPSNAGGDRWNYSRFPKNVSDPT